eukprot:scaffold3813_cov146-Amphora_coffeaeformis.AAC.2
MRTRRKRERERERERRNPNTISGTTSDVTASHENATTNNNPGPLVTDAVGKGVSQIYVRNSYAMASGFDNYSP